MRFKIHLRLACVRIIVLGLFAFSDLSLSAQNKNTPESIALTKKIANAIRKKLDCDLILTDSTIEPVKCPPYFRIHIFPKKERPNLYNVVIVKNCEVDFIVHKSEPSLELERSMSEIISQEKVLLLKFYQLSKKIAVIISSLNLAG